MLRQAHVSCLCHSPHRAVEVCRPGEVHERAGELAVGHHYDVKPAVALAGSWQTAHAQVFLLLSILLVANKVICQKT